jgi:hypothetical protein
MEVIGFTTKYYTLWEVTEDIIREKWGSYKRITHQYIKNISYDFDKAKEKYPNAVVDTALRGHTSFRSTEWIERYGVDEFIGGKYKGDKISTCGDYNYLLWAWDLGYIIPYDSREIAVKVLEDAGYKRINDSKIVTPEELEKIEASFSECEDNMKVLDETGEITFDFHKNLDECGCITIGNTQITFKPEKYKELEYSGYYYGLPIDSKGKAKRVKGKTVKIIPESYEIAVSEYGWGATLMITVKDFEIVK